MSLAYILVATVALGAEAQDEKAPVPPEMKVLRKLAGSWKAEFESTLPEKTQRTHIHLHEYMLLFCLFSQ